MQKHLKESTSLNVHQNTFCFVFLERTTQNLTAAHAKMQKAVARMTAF